MRISDWSSDVCSSDLIVEHHVADNAQLRLGGLVTPGSVKRGDGLQVDFTLADCVKSLPVRYEGILPDLFKGGQGIVATGRMQNGVFVADQVQIGRASWRERVCQYV